MAMRKSCEQAPRRLVLVRSDTERQHYPCACLLGKAALRPVCPLLGPAKLPEHDSKAVEWHADDVQPARQPVECEGAQIVGRCAQD